MVSDPAVLGSEAFAHSPNQLPANLSPEAPVGRWAITLSINPELTQ